MVLFSGYELGRSRYEVLIYRDGRLAGIFSTDADFARPVIMREAQRDVAKLKTESPRSVFGIEEKDNSKARGNGNPGFGNWELIFIKLFLFERVWKKSLK